LNEPQFSDPTAFIAQIDSLALISVWLTERAESSSSFFGLPHSFWEILLNEKLSSGSIKYACADKIDYQVMKAPINLPDKPIGSLGWEKVDVE
ncbi:hypothetical protein PMAYCL1PPCAC_27473, partial [Pristionchus mayeri]